GLEIIPLPIRRVEDIASAFEELKGRRGGALYYRRPSCEHAPAPYQHLGARRALPTMFLQREYVEAAGLMSYGPSFPDLNRRAAEYVDNCAERSRATCRSSSRRSSISSSI